MKNLAMNCDVCVDLSCVALPIEEAEKRRHSVAFILQYAIVFRTAFPFGDKILRSRFDSPQNGKLAEMAVFGRAVLGPRISLRHRWAGLYLQ